MATDVTMPRLSDSMEEGTVLKWLVEVGGEVKRGEALVEIETDKANMTYEADTSGVLIEVVAGEGDTLAIGEVIARIGEEGEEPAGQDESGGAEEESEDESEGSDGSDSDGDAAEQAVAKADEAKEKAQDATRALSDNGASEHGDRVKASPVARRMAKDMGVELAQLEGSGPGGRIVKADVEAAAK